MARVKGGIVRHKARKHLLEYTKGFRWGRKSKIKEAKEAMMKSLFYAWRDRRNKKRDLRRLWQTQINAAVRPLDLSYSKFISGLKKNKIELDRKILSELAKSQPEIFSKIAERVKS